MRSFSLALSLALVAVLAMTGSAGAVIVPQKSIAGVKLKMTRAQVVAAKGKPDAERVVDNEILGRQRIMRYGRTQIGFNGEAADATVSGVRTTARGQRTRSGVGRGSTQAAVEAGVPGVTCEDEFGVSHCFKGEFATGQRVTDFQLNDNGRVRSVFVGFVID
ncbi:MAG TPA: hypothetical protein VFB52_13840 [Solirubrobacterales bacterium]|nr:hypothetical protein [Solirubrobacterales bacterium]